VMIAANGFDLIVSLAALYGAVWAWRRLSR
jgi:hypothetical protein